jgi:hypothetical protein
MKLPRHRFLGFTWPDWLNLIVLQWFFVRLGYLYRYELCVGLMPLAGWRTAHRRLRCFRCYPITLRHVP